MAKTAKGTGLGLSIVREIVAAHNQNINVISTEGSVPNHLYIRKKAGERADSPAFFILSFFISTHIWSDDHPAAYDQKLCCLSAS